MACGHYRASNAIQWKHNTNQSIYNTPYFKKGRDPNHGYNLSIIDLCKILSTKRILVYLLMIDRRISNVDILKERLIAVWSDFWQDINDTAIDQWRKCLQACVRANGGHFEYLLWANSRKRLTFLCVFGSSDFCPSCEILLCWCLMVVRPTLLNCITLSLLRTVYIELWKSVSMWR